jgi:hypothetical protein
MRLEDSSAGTTYTSNSHANMLSAAPPIKLVTPRDRVAQLLPRTIVTLAAVKHVLVLGAIHDGASVRMPIDLLVVCIQGNGAVGGFVSQDSTIVYHGHRATTAAVHGSYRSHIVRGLFEGFAHVAHLDAIVPYGDAYSVADDPAIS